MKYFFPIIPLLILDLALPSLATDNIKSNNNNPKKPNVGSSFQVSIEKRRKLKQNTAVNMKTSNPYSVSQPYNPNNPPPINNKIHPLSSNAR